VVPVTLSEDQKQVGSSTLNRALDVLEELTAGPPAGMTASQLAERTGSNRVSIHRILATYLQHGYVRQDGPGAPYRLGFRLIELGEKVIGDIDIARIAYPLLEELSTRTGETCHLGLLSGPEAVYVAKIESSQSVRLVSHIGARVPLYCTSLGKALLAAADDDLREQLIAQQSFERRTAHTLTTPKALRADLELTRARGYSIDAVENEEGVRCVGAAVLDHTGAPIAAVSLSGPTTRVTIELVEELGRLAHGTAERVSTAIGHGSDGRAHAGARSARPATPQ
jgi:IclR family KDG regulon transcriptional repressor